MKLTDSKKRLLFEFIRYCVVGGTAFLVETATHWLLWKFVFTDTQSGVNIFIVTTIGFLVGLAVNYILSVVWVFTTEKQQKQGKTVKAFLIFALIGLVGAETVPLQYYATHIISAGIVLVWNYIGRKVIIFRK